MPPRTLVIGSPLPHVTFDNYSFASAPSFSEYTRLIVEMSAVSGVVEEITLGAAEHKTFAGQPIANGDTTPRAFSLAGLLRMRAREASALINRGGAILCIAYPDAAHDGISGIGRWHSYEWLPEPEGFRFQADLLPGFGKGPVEVSDPAHPFAPYIDACGRRMSYRVHVSAETSGRRAFGRSVGGLAVAFDVQAGDGVIVFVPPLQDPEKDRIDIAGTLFECFERLDSDRAAHAPDNFAKEAS